MCGYICVWMCTCLCLRVCVYLHIHRSMHMYLCLYLSTCALVCINLCSLVCMFVSVHVYCVCKCVCTWMHGWLMRCPALTDDSSASSERLCLLPLWDKELSKGQVTCSRPHSKFGQLCEYLIAKLTLPLQDQAASLWHVGTLPRPCYPALRAPIVGNKWLYAITRDPAGDGSVLRHWKRRDSQGDRKKGTLHFVWLKGWK